MKSHLRTRREFLSNCGVAALGLAVPQFIFHTAETVGREAGWEPFSGQPLPGFADDRILVVVQLSGGNDGLNTLIPFADDAYYRVRPNIGIQPGARLPLDDQLALHSSLVPLKNLYDAGNVAIVEGVGYPNPDRSHFRSMEIWHTASDSNLNETSGWIGRYFDNCCNGAPEPTAGLYIGQELPQAFHGSTGTGLAFQAPERFGFVEGATENEKEIYRRLSSAPAADPHAASGSLDFLHAMTQTANISADRVHEIARRVGNSRDYPRNPFAQGLSVIARMIRGNLGSRIYYIALSGFDTHANQRGAHERLLTTYAEGVAAFYDDLRAMGISESVLTMTFSEFGRRVQENASGGTDHGTAAPMFLIGDGVKPGLHGKRPDLSTLDPGGDLIYTTDFRSVYASVLRQWFGADPSVVLRRRFPELALLQA